MPRTPRNSPNPIGNPPYKPADQDRRLVTILRGAGVPPETIARELKISLPTLRKHFCDEMEHGREAIIARIGGKLVQKALAGDNSSMQYYLSRQGGESWKDKRILEHTTPANQAATTEPYPQLPLIGDRSGRVVPLPRPKAALRYRASGSAAAQRQPGYDLSGDPGRFDG